MFRGLHVSLERPTNQSSAPWDVGVKRKPVRYGRPGKQRTGEERPNAVRAAETITITPETGWVLKTVFLPVVRDDEFSAPYTRRLGVSSTTAQSCFSVPKTASFRFFSYRGRALSVCSTGNENVRAHMAPPYGSRPRIFRACRRHVEKHWSDFRVLLFFFLPMSGRVCSVRRIERHSPVSFFQTTDAHDPPGACGIRCTSSKSHVVNSCHARSNNNNNNNNISLHVKRTPT